MQFILDRMAGAAADAVVMVRDDQKTWQRHLVGGIFALCGFIPIGVGAVMWTQGTILDQGFHLPLFLMSFGATFVAGGGLAFVAMGQQARGVPRSLKFNNPQGYLEISMAPPTDMPTDGTSGQKARLPYHTLRGFEEQTLVRRTSSDSGGSRTYYLYAVNLLRADGGRWRLLEGKDSEKARDVCEYLKTNVKLENSGPEHPHIDPSGRFKVASSIGAQGDERTISWHTNRSPVTPLLLAALVSGFGGILVAASARLPGILGAMSYVLFGIAALILYAAFRPGAGNYRIAINRESVTSELPGIFGTTQRTTPLAEIETVVFNIGDTDRNTQLMLLRKEERQALEPIWAGGMAGMTLSTLGLLRKINAFDASALTVLELLELESLIEKEIGQRTGASVR